MTISQALAHLVTVRYSPPSWRPLHWLSLVAAASGVALLLLSRGHYSIGQFTFACHTCNQLTNRKHLPVKRRLFHWYLYFCLSYLYLVIMTTNRNHLDHYSIWSVVKNKKQWPISIIQTCYLPTMWQRDCGIFITQLLAIKQWGKDTFYFKSSFLFVINYIIDDDG